MDSLNSYTPLSCKSLDDALIVDSFNNVKRKLQQMKTRSLDNSEIELLKSQLNQCIFVFSFSMYSFGSIMEECTCYDCG